MLLLLTLVNDRSSGDMEVVQASVRTNQRASKIIRLGSCHRQACLEINAGKQVFEHVEYQLIFLTYFTSSMTKEELADDDDIFLKFCSKDTFL